MTTEQKAKLVAASTSMDEKMAELKIGFKKLSLGLKELNKSLAELLAAQK